MSEYSDRLQAERRAAGLCKCGGEPPPGGKQCHKCRWRAKQLRQSKPDAAKKYRVEAKQKYQANRALGLCSCGAQPRPGKRSCQECYAYRTMATDKYESNLVQMGRCKSCNGPSVVGLQCMLHWAETLGVRNTGERGHGARLLAIWERQGGRCRYTGLPLVPGLTASLDHKLPLSRGGSASTDNLEWVHAVVNHSKSAMTPEEFIDLCRVVTTGAAPSESVSYLMTPENWPVHRARKKHYENSVVAKGLEPPTCTV